MTAPHVPTLRALDPDLWIADQPLRFLGLELGARMTVVRFGGNRLVLHSPIARSPSLEAELGALGRPGVLIAPNRFHHLYIGDWQTAHPEARLLVAPGLLRKRPDLAAARPLDAAAAIPDPARERRTDVVASGSDDDLLAQAGLESALLEGCPLMNEVVSFHRASGTLVVSDLVFHVGPEHPVLTRLAFRAMGAYGRPSVTPLERLLVRDRTAFRRSLERVLDWPIRRIVPAHGALVEGDAKRALRDAWGWLLR